MQWKGKKKGDSWEEKYEVVRDWPSRTTCPIEHHPPLQAIYTLSASSLRFRQ